MSPADQIKIYVRLKSIWKQKPRFFLVNTDISRTTEESNAGYVLCAAKLPQCPINQLYDSYFKCPQLQKMRPVL